MQITDPRFNNKQPVTLEVDRYAANDNLALSGKFPDGRTWAQYTTNMGARLHDPLIAIKVWSEGEGADQVLIQAGVIEPEAQGVISNGYVSAPIFRLTEQAIKELGL